MKFQFSAQWRLEPRAVAGWLAPGLREDVVALDVSSVASRLDHLRVFLMPNEATPQPRSRLVPSPEAGPVLERLLQSNLRFTVLMNSIERVSPAARAVQKALAVPYRWRTDDVVLTYSTPGAGVGYHAGHEDAFILQVAGRRLWKVWHAREVDQDARRRLVLSEPGDIYPFVEPAAPPLLECELNPGDVLYIPPFFPHMGVTLETSTSMALGWRGVAYYHLVVAFPDAIKVLDDRDPRTALELFDLLPDWRIGGDRSEVVAHVEAVLAGLTLRGCQPAPSRLAERLMRLFGSTVRP